MEDLVEAGQNITSDDGLKLEPEWSGGWSSGSRLQRVAEQQCQPRHWVPRTCGARVWFAQAGRLERR